MDTIKLLALIIVVGAAAIVLFVALTVILAAVIAAFVFSMSSDVPAPHTVAFTIKKTTSDDIVIENAGGPDVDMLKSVSVSYEPWSPNSHVYVIDEDALDQLTSTGGTLTIPADGGTPADPADDPVTPTHVTVTGIFSDGQMQVLCACDV